MVITRKRKTVFLALLLFVFLFSVVFPTQMVFASSGDIKVEVDGSGGLTVDMGQFSSHEKAWNQFLEKYRNFIIGISGVGAVTMVALFIKQFIKLGSCADNPMERSRALQGVLWTGVAAAALGAVAIITGFFYHAFG